MEGDSTIRKWESESQVKDFGIVSFVDCLLFLCCRYFFLEFSTPQEAVNAVKARNGYRLDKSRVFKVNLFSDFEKLAVWSGVGVV